MENNKSENPPIIINILEKILSPFISKDGCLKLPRNKKARFVYVFLFAILMMIVSIIYFETNNVLLKVALSLINLFKK